MTAPTQAETRGPVTDDICLNCVGEGIGCGEGENGVVEGGIKKRGEVCDY